MQKPQIQEEKSISAVAQFELSQRPKLSSKLSDIAQDWLGSVGHLIDIDSIVSLSQSITSSVLLCFDFM